MTSLELEKIKQRLSRIPCGKYTLHSIGVKNYLLWVGGDWPENKDLDLCEFFANAGTDVANLIKDCESYRDYNEDMKSLCEKQAVEIEELRSEIKRLKGVA
jgi:hypothetical protein